MVSSMVIVFFFMGMSVECVFIVPMNVIVTVVFLIMVVVNSVSVMSSMSMRIVRFLNHVNVVEFMPIGSLHPSESRHLPVWISAQSTVDSFGKAFDGAVDDSSGSIG